ncbi:MAG TPA: hydroxymethylbilane synthase [Candidatus Nanoarchaeia archaeon]|nr:hydroxymethylbilane synthase [Candidatus Nanoarchaeia archaeon]
MIIGTRGSALALAQANLVTALLKERGFETERTIIKTSGDSFTDRPLHEVPGVGAFVRDIDDRMLSGELDIAVHSMKDMPTERPPELATAAVLKRDSPYDVLLTRDGSTLDDMPVGAVIGTTSMRRRSQLLRYRPDLTIKDLRGNIDTRRRKLKEGQYDGILLAEAGLQRMGWELDVYQLDPDLFCPSANQGTVAIVTPRGSESHKAVALLDHPQTNLETKLERIVIGILGGGCLVPIAAFAETESDNVRIRAEVLALDGSRFVKVDEVVPLDSCEEEAARLGHALAQQGGAELVKEAVEKLSVM